MQLVGEGDRCSWWFVIFWEWMLIGCFSSSRPLAGSSRRTLGAHSFILS